jgi:hypothetical protein
MVEQDPVNGVDTNLFHAGGTLCFHTVTITGVPSSYTVQVGDIYGMVQCSGTFTDDTIVYKTPEGVCYTGNLNKTGIITLEEV